jgi:hypothetical protein
MVMKGYEAVAGLEDWTIKKPDRVIRLGFCGVRFPKVFDLGVPGVISGKFTVRKRATTSLSVAGHAYSPKKQDVMLYITSYAERDVSVLGSTTSRITPGYRPS